MADNIPVEKFKGETDEEYLERAGRIIATDDFAVSKSSYAEAIHRLKAAYARIKELEERHGK